MENNTNKELEGIIELSAFVKKVKQEGILHAYFQQSNDVDLRIVDSNDGYKTVIAIHFCGLPNRELATATCHLAELAISEYRKGGEK